MGIPAALATDLASLTAALGTPGTDLEALLVGLSRSIRLAVPSCVGLSMTVVMDGFPLSLATVDEVAEVAASMRLPLSALGVAGPGCVVVFYSANPGAFVDLAADAAFALGSDHPVLDHDLHPPVAIGVGGLEAMSAVSRAIGYLIGEGWTPEGAHTELHRRARVAGTSRHIAALHVTRAATE